MTWCRQDPFIYGGRYRSHLFILSSNDTYVSVPFLSLGSSTVRSYPSQSTSSHCKINRSSWPNKTQISEKKYEAIRDHAYKRSKKTQITFMDKKIDLIINSKFIGSQQTHCKRIYIIWISKKPCIENSARERERGSHLATNYGPEGLQRTTHAWSERHQWRWWTPSEMVSRLDLVVMDFPAAGWIFRRLP